MVYFFFFKQKTAYEMRISDWSSDLCSSDLLVAAPPHAVGGRIEDRSGNWRFYAENGFDEGHAKYLHRTSLWRTFKMMPTWNKIHIEKQGRWLYRVEDERYWEDEFPGVGKWSNDRWWKIKPKQHQRSEEHTSELQSLMRNSY